MKYAWVEDFLKDDAIKQNKISGYYNDNYFVKRNDESLVIRVPREKSFLTRVVPEIEILGFLEKMDFPAPRLLYAERNSKYVVLSFIHGEALSKTYSRGKRVPDWIPVHLGQLIKRLHKMNTSSFNQFSIHLLDNTPKSRVFFQFILDQTKEMYSKYYLQLKDVYDELLFPRNPFEVCEKDRENLLDRNFVLSHCDIHRANLICDEPNRTVTLIDWETGLVGDPAYEIAIHLQKMRYEPDQEQILLNEYLKDNVQFRSLFELQAQVDIYRKLEQLTLAIIDTSRYINDLKSGSLQEEEYVDYASRYYQKLRRVWELWGIRNDSFQVRNTIDFFNEAAAKK